MVKKHDFRKMSSDFFFVKKVFEKHFYDLFFTISREQSLKVSMRNSYYKSKTQPHSNFSGLLIQLGYVTKVLCSYDDNSDKKHAH